MNTAFLVTSIIDVTDDPLTYSDIRSVFNKEERLQQTLATIESINQNGQYQIYLLELSKECYTYKSIFEQFTNLKFINCQEEFPDVHAEIITHPNKSRGECLLMQNFLSKYQTDLLNYEALVKLSGRYIIEPDCNLKQLNDTNIFFKYPLKTTWQDWWNYDMVKLNSDYLAQYCTIIWAWGNKQFDLIYQLYKQIGDLLSREDMQHYDIETLIYFYSRPYANNIIEVNWPVSGWIAPSGNYIRI